MKKNENKFLWARLESIIGVISTSTSARSKIGSGRNTSAAVFFSALASDPDDVLCIMPSDHWIRDDTYYCNLVNSGIPEACEGKWVTFGIKPTEPATGYGYIKTTNVNDKIF